MHKKEKAKEAKTKEDTVVKIHTFVEILLFWVFSETAKKKPKKCKKKDTKKQTLENDNLYEYNEDYLGMNNDINAYKINSQYNDDDYEFTNYVSFENENSNDNDGYDSYENNNDNGVQYYENGDTYYAQEFIDDSDENKENDDMFIKQYYDEMQVMFFIVCVTAFCVCLYVCFCVCTCIFLNAM